MRYGHWAGGTPVHPRARRMHRAGGGAGDAPSGKESRRRRSLRYGQGHEEGVTAGGKGSCHFAEPSSGEALAEWIQSECVAEHWVTSRALAQASVSLAWPLRRASPQRRGAERQGEEDAATNNAHVRGETPVERVRRRVRERVVRVRERHRVGDPAE